MLFAALLAGMASFASAGPIADATPQDNTALAAFMGKRDLLPTSNCGITTETTVTNTKAMHALMYLTNNTMGGDGSPPEIVWGQPGQNTMLVCRGKTGVWLNVHPEASVPIGWFGIPYPVIELGHQLDATWHDCMGGPPPDDMGTTHALQFLGNGYDLLIRGDSPCE